MSTQVAMHGSVVVLTEAAIPGRLDQTLVFPADHPGFQGHFDGFPILPAVVQVDWCVQQLRRFLPDFQGLASLTRLKFMQPVSPGQELRLELEWDLARSRISFKYLAGEGVYSTGRGTLMLKDSTPGTLPGCHGEGRGG